jgi:plastocyanin
MRRYLTFVLMLGLAAGCGGKEETTTPAASEVSVPVAASKTFDPSTAGTVRGRALFDGAAPETKMLSVKGNPECSVQHAGGQLPSEELVVNGGALQNVFVYVKEGLEGYSFPVPAEPVVIENRKCVYVPHVAGAMAGQTVNFVNKDSTLHNIHSYPKASKGFNLGLPLVDMKQSKKFETPEVMVPLKCDVHPWMLGYLGVVAHPFFAVTDAQGNFELKGLPPGEYTLEAWHEKLGARSQTLRIEPQSTQDAEFRFGA